MDERDASVEHDALGAVRVAERDGDVVAEARAEERRTPMSSPLAVTGSVNCAARRERERAQRGLGRRERRGELRPRRRREVGAPAADRRQRAAGSATKPKVVPGRDVAGEPDDRRGGRVEMLRAVQHRHELLQVLGEDVGRGNGVVRLVVLALEERRAVRDGEEGERRGSRRGTSLRSRRAPGCARARPRRAEARPARAVRRGRCARSVGASRRAAATVAAKTISAGTRSRNALVPPLLASCAAPTEPRAQPIEHDGDARRSQPCRAASARAVRAARPARGTVR